MGQPLVGIIMGSSSDWETMRHAAETLEMPFKDNFDLPDPLYGWSPERSKYLAFACLDALYAILPDLKKAKKEKA